MSVIDDLEEQIGELDEKLDKMESRLENLEELRNEIEEFKINRIGDKNYEVEFSRFDERIRKIEKELRLGMR